MFIINLNTELVLYMVNNKFLFDVPITYLNPHDDVYYDVYNFDTDDHQQQYEPDEEYIDNEYTELIPNYSDPNFKNKTSKSLLYFIVMSSCIVVVSNMYMTYLQNVGEV